MRRVGPTAVVGLLVLGGLLGVLTLSSRVATANTLYVGGGGPGNYTSIQAAVNAAFPGDTVFVYSGNYTENVTVTKTLNLVGEGMETTFLHGAGAYYTLNVGADWVNVTGLSVVGGVASCSTIVVVIRQYTPNIGARWLLQPRASISRVRSSVACRSRVWRFMSSLSMWDPARFAHCEVLPSKPIAWMRNVIGSHPPPRQHSRLPKRRENILSP